MNQLDSFVWEKHCFHLIQWCSKFFNVYEPSFEFQRSDKLGMKAFLFWNYYFFSFRFIHFSALHSAIATVSPFYSERVRTDMAQKERTYFYEYAIYAICTLNAKLLSLFRHEKLLKINFLYFSHVQCPQTHPKNWLETHPLILCKRSPMLLCEYWNMFCYFAEYWFCYFIFCFFLF